MKIIKKIKVDLGDRSYPIIIGNGIYGNKNLYRNSKIPEFNLSKETIDLLKDMLEINPLKRIDIIEVGYRLDEINRFYK